MICEFFGARRLAHIDYDDFIVHVNQTDENQVALTFKKTWYAANYWVWDKKGNQIGDPTVSMGFGNNCGPFTFTGTTELSYGMNWRIAHIPRGLHRVVALDYRREVANVGGGLEYPDNWENGSALRHLGQLNVLFADGTVSPMASDEIDPTPTTAGEISEIDELYWEPNP